MSVCKGRVRAIDKKAFETYWYRISGLEPYCPVLNHITPVLQRTAPIEVLDSYYVNYQPYIVCWDHCSPL